MTISQENLRKYGETLKVYKNKHKHNGETISDANVYKFSLAYSLVPFLLEVFSEFQFSDYSIEKFNELLINFNSNSSTNITLESLLARGYIRIILDRVYIANKVYWSLPRSLDETHDDIDESEGSIINFLSAYRNTLQCEVIIPKDVLESLLEKHNIPAQDFLDLDIFHTSDDVNYVWSGYSARKLSCLSDDLVFEIIDTKFREESFSRENIIWLINTIFDLELDWYTEKLNIWLAALSEESQETFFNILIDVLDNEPDLKNSDIEWLKSILDLDGYGSYRYITENGVCARNKVPNFPINTTQPAEIVDLIDKYQGHDEIYLHQTHRSKYDFMVNILLRKHYFFEDSPLKKYLLDSESPYLSYQIIEQIKRYEIEKLPALVNVNMMLTSLVFKVVDTLDIDDNSLRTYNAFHNGSRDAKELEYVEIKKDLISTLFRICFNKDLFLRHLNLEELSKCISQVLFYFADKAFSNNFQSFSYSNKIYELIINELNSIFESIYRIENINLTVIKLLFQNLIEICSKQQLNFHNLIQLNAGSLKLLTDVYETSSIYFSTITEWNEIEGNIAQTIYEHLTWYFTTLETNKLSPFTAEIQVDVASRFSNSVAFDNIDWSTVFLVLHKHKHIESLVDSFTKNINFLPEDSKTYASSSDNPVFVNKTEQTTKIKHFLKILLLALTQLGDKDILKTDTHGVKKELIKHIKLLCLQYRTNDLTDNKINAFVFEFHIDQHMNQKQNRELLFAALNNFDSSDEIIEFLTEFFLDSIDLGLMLEALTAIDDSEVKHFLATKIESIDVGDFIASAHWIPELRVAMINAINSDNNYQLAMPLLDKLEAHYNSRQSKRDLEDFNRLKNEIKLLLAYKEKQIGSQEAQDLARDAKLGHVYQLYKATSLVDVKRFDEAEKILDSIKDLDNKVDVMVQMTRSILLNPHRSHEDKMTAVSEWERFIKTYITNNTSINKRYIFENRNYLTMLSLKAYSREEESDRFYEIFYSLTDPYKFSIEIIEDVLDRLTQDDLHIQHRNYIQCAESFHDKNSKSDKEIILKLLNKRITLKEIKQFQQAITTIHSLSPKDLPNLIPENLISNSQRALNLFLLEQIIHSVKSMVKKMNVFRIRQADGKFLIENKYNDLVKVILEARLEFLNFKIEEQERVGKSKGGNDAGELDLSISYKANKIALIEAFRLEGKNSNVVQDHSDKIHNYDSNIENYYNLIYFIGESNRMDSCWQEYQLDFANTDFHADMFIDSIKGFENLGTIFSNTNDMKIARTYHGAGHKYNYFHIMVNLSAFT